MKVQDEGKDEGMEVEKEFVKFLLNP